MLLYSSSIFVISVIAIVLMHANANVAFVESPGSFHL